MISFLCPKCGNQLNIPDQYAGKVGRCNKCGEQVTAPQAQADLGLPPDLANLNIDLDSYKVPPAAPRVSRGSGTDWIMIVGWSLFALGVLTMFTRFWLVASGCWLASLILIGIDGPKRDLSGGQMAKWIILTFLFWLAAFPCYMALRNRDEDQGSPVPLVLGIVALAIIGSCGGGFYMVAKGLNEAAQDPEVQQAWQEFQRGMEQAQQAQQQGQIPAGVPEQGFLPSEE
ncbi:MAG: hypothetical protein IT365_24890 [Candidatus Hydrogenedentes bacterium]|nr:hypothetical protein [Candidatus Hydrogenedentota bacterium]